MGDGTIVMLDRASVCTVTVADALFPSADAVITVVPGATAATTPPEVTVAIAGADVDQAIVRPVNVFPVASFGVADACIV
jgi:hypothetical protein